MTWLRWDVETPQSDVVGYLADALDCGVAQALGHYFACCSGFGQHRPDGKVAEVTDVTLEHWAIWTGRKGRFAAAFRARCVGEDGLLRGWWRNLAIIRKQMNDARKPDGRKGRQRHESPETPATHPRGISGGNDTTTTTPSVSTGTGTTDVAVEPEAAVRVAVALNRGLQENPRIGSAMNPVMASAGTQTVVDWRRSGIPLAFLEEAVYGIAKAYAGEGQIGSMAYCDRAVRKAWARSQARPDGAAGSESGPPAPRQPVTKLRRV